MMYLDADCLSDFLTNQRPLEIVVSAVVSELHAINCRERVNFFVVSIDPFDCIFLLPKSI